MLWRSINIKQYFEQTVLSITLNPEKSKVGALWFSESENKDSVWLPQSKG